jgi:hypothetical protein
VSPKHPVDVPQDVLLVGQQSTRTKHQSSTQCCGGELAKDVAKQTIVQKPGNTTVITILQNCSSSCWIMVRKRELLHSFPNPRLEFSVFALAHLVQGALACDVHWEILAIFLWVKLIIAAAFPKWSHGPRFSLTGGALIFSCCADPGSVGG